MAQKVVNVPGLGDVLLQKRKGAKNIRLSVSADGQIRVGLPAWVPYAAGIQFARSRSSWIEKQRSKVADVQFTKGIQIGKSHRLVFRELNSTELKATARLTATEIIISANLPLAHPKIQIKAHEASEKALRRQASALLPLRLQELAKKHDYSYSGPVIKKLKSRWGSCTANGKISLSYYLMQLPWNLIDYVLLHELTHTKHLNHSQAFWAELTRAYPDTKAARRLIKEYSPSISPMNEPRSSMS